MSTSPVTAITKSSRMRGAMQSSSGRAAAEIEGTSPHVGNFSDGPDMLGCCDCRGAAGRNACPALSSYSDTR
eukprot:3775795-Amphidinium_carterae.1